MTAPTQEQIDKFISLKLERKLYFLKMKASNTNLSVLKKSKDPAFKEEKEKHLVLLEGWKALNSQIDALEDIVGKVKVPILKRERTPEEIELAREKRKNKEPKKENALYVFPLLSYTEGKFTPFLMKEVFPIVAERSLELQKSKKQQRLNELLSGEQYA